MEKKDKKKKAVGDVDFDIGGFGLGGLFKGVEKLIDLAAELKDAGGGALKKEGEVDLSHLKQGMKAVYGFSVKTMDGGKPVVEQFGNIKKTPKGPKVEEEREPITDLFDEKDEVRVCAEMPGLNEGDIKLDLKDDILEITAHTGDRKYCKEVLLPIKAKPENMTFAYRNGILEVKIKKG